VFKKVAKSQWRKLKRRVGRELNRKHKYTAWNWIIGILLALWVSSYLP